MATSPAPSVKASSEILWEGHPWVVPRLIGITIALLIIALFLTFVEVRSGTALVSILSVPLIDLTIGIIVILWIIGGIGLAILRAMHKYTLRQSSMDIATGILSRKTYTLSAAGFSDLEVVQGIEGRLLNMGNIEMETDSSRDLRLIMIHNPVVVGAKIRSVMTIPEVRLAPQPPPAPEQK